jgi:hypothetical protein
MVVLAVPLLVILLIIACICTWGALDSLQRGGRVSWQIPILIVSVAVAMFLLMELALVVYDATH